MITVASHQPNFFPYMGYFYKMFKSDKFVLSVDVNFTKDVYHNYTDIKTPSGKQRITVPVNSHSDVFRNVMVSPDNDWRKKMIRTIRQNYRKAPFFNQYIGEIESIILRDYQYLYQLNIATILFVCKCLEIERQLFISDELDLREKKDSRILEMCRKLHADEYYSGLGAKAYHIPEDYVKNGVKLTYTDYASPVYEQIYGEFIGNLSSLDWLFNCGGRLPEGWCK